MFLRRAVLFFGFFLNLGNFCFKEIIPLANTFIYQIILRRISTEVKKPHKIAKSAIQLLNLAYIPGMNEETVCFHMNMNLTYQWNLNNAQKYLS